MLGKLLKYEWKNTMNFLVPLHLALLLLTVGGRILIGAGLNGNADLVGVVALIVYFMGIFVISVATTIYLLYRFYKNFFTDEGYLMFTLPVKVHQLLLSKLITAVGWLMINFAFSAASVLLILQVPKILEPLREGFPIMQESIMEMTGLSFPGFLVLVLILTIISSVQGTLMLYFCMAVGSFFGKHKIIGAFASYIAIYSVLQIISVIVLLLAGFSMAMSESEIIYFYRMTLWFGCAFGVVMLVGFYIGTHYILSKKLNLD